MSSGRQGDRVILFETTLSHNIGGIMRRIALCASVVVFTACGRGEQLRSDAHAVSQASGDVTRSARVCSRALRIAAFQDKSYSGGVNATPQVGVPDLEPLISRVSECGGELALGIIARNSNAPLARMYVAEPAAAPVKPVFRGSTFDVSKQKARFRTLMEAYDSAMAVRDSAAQREADAFRRSAAALLSVPDTAMRSDIVGALDRGAYFAAEPGQWVTPPQVVLAIISDAADNIRQVAVPMPSYMKTMVINGAPTALTTLEKLGISAVRFESFAAATREILHNQ